MPPNPDLDAKPQVVAALREHIARSLSSETGRSGRGSGRGTRQRHATCAAGRGGFPTVELTKDREYGSGVGPYARFATKSRCR